MRTLNLMATAGLAAGFLVATTDLVSAQGTYIIRDLGTVSGGPVSSATHLNDFGRVCGRSIQPDSLTRGFDWNGSMTAVPPLLNDSLTHATAIGQDGSIVAISYDLGELATHGILWQNGTTTNLGTLAPRGMNQTGMIVGFLSTDDANFGRVDHAALWQAGVLLDLGTLGGHFSYAYAVSDNGRLVGVSFNTNDANPRAALWQNNVWRDLGTLGGAKSQAYDINEAGQIVGVADAADGRPHPFRYQLDSAGNVVTRTDLGALGGGYGYAYGINEQGQVVGTSDGRAFLWSDGTMVDLNSLLPPNSIWRLESAWAINNHGQIVGVGYHKGQPRAFRMTPGLPGDLNCDWTVTIADIQAFALALVDTSAYEQGFGLCEAINADVNGDGSADGLDVGAFVTLLLGG